MVFYPGYGLSSLDSCSWFVIQLLTGYYFDDDSAGIFFKLVDEIHLSV